METLLLCVSFSLWGIEIISVFREEVFKIYYYCVYNDDDDDDDGYVYDKWMNMYGRDMEVRGQL